MINASQGVQYPNGAHEKLHTPTEHRSYMTMSICHAIYNKLGKLVV